MITPITVNNPANPALDTPFNGRLTVLENSGNSPLGSPIVNGLLTVTYMIVLTRSPVQPVRITASPVTNSERERTAGGKTIRLNVGRAGTNDASDVGVSVLFDRTNWFVPQYITISGDQDALAEGLRSINIQHKVVEALPPPRRSV